MSRDKTCSVKSAAVHQISAVSDLEQPIEQAYAELQHRYQRLERRLNKIARIGDLMQAQIMELNHELQLRANTDSLTGLLNRSGIYPHIHDLIAETEQATESFGVLLLDLDHFKYVNDCFGHQVGDALLVAVAKVLKGLSVPNFFCARWGGEEFLLLLPQRTLAQTVAIGEHVLAEVRCLSLPQIGTHPVSISAGVYLCDKPGATVDSCIRRADLALYQAKAQGRDCLVIYAPEMEQARVVLSELV